MHDPSGHPWIPNPNQGHRFRDHCPAPPTPELPAGCGAWFSLVCRRFMKFPNINIANRIKPVSILVRCQLAESKIVTLTWRHVIHVESKAPQKSLGSNLRPVHHSFTIFAKPSGTEWIQVVMKECEWQVCPNDPKKMSIGVYCCAYNNPGLWRWGRLSV